MITIWRRYECTQIDDTAPRFAWYQVPRSPDVDAARAAIEAARRRWSALDREDLLCDIRAIVREEVAREALQAKEAWWQRWSGSLTRLGRHG